MKEQTAILPELPIVGTLKLTTRDGKSLSGIDVVKARPPSELSAFFQMCLSELQGFLEGQRTHIQLPLDLSSVSLFQRRVLEAMKHIPYGSVASYKDLAEELNTKGYQAIGTACGKNPFLLIYPCHRVIGSHDLGGFAHGLEMKKALLRLEGFLA
jgi:O-6-methylguanine DNA methyltransferase